MDNSISVKYMDYLTNHIANVKRAYDWLIMYLPELFDADNSYKIDECIKAHDQSKYSETEYNAYAEYFYGKRATEVDQNFNYAWLHHIHNNPHHWQHWILIQDDESTLTLDMPYEYIIEMICDWWSFSWRIEKLDEIFSWYNSHCSTIKLSDNTRKIVEEILDKIKVKLDT